MSKITINGKHLQTTHQTVQLVVNELGLSAGHYAVKVNGTLTPESELGKVRVVDGMNLEVVQATNNH